MQKLDGSRGWRRADGGPSSLVALAAALVAGCGPSRPAASPEPPATVYVLAAPPAAIAPAMPDEPAPPVRPRTQREWQVLEAGEDLSTAVRVRAREAAGRGLLPVLYVTARGCDPCQSLKDSLPDPRMQEAFAGTSILEVDLHQSAAVLAGLGLSVHGIPAFYVLGEQGRPTGATITGAAWGDDIPENMAPPLGEFFAMQPR